MSAHDEKQRRRKTCFFIDECGVRLQLPKLPVMTAQCFFHKFFSRESFRRHDRFVVAQACLFLAAKVEESAVSLRSLVRECHGVRYAGKSRAPLDESSERDVKRSVVMAERAVLYARRGVSFRPSLLAFRSPPRRRPQWPARFGNERCVGRGECVCGGLVLRVRRAARTTAHSQPLCSRSHLPGADAKR